MRRVACLFLTSLLATAPAAAAEDGVVVHFAPGSPGSKLAPRYSPKGMKVALAAREAPAPEGHAPLEGRLQLGPAATRGSGRLVVLARSKPEGPYDLLWLDANGDGELGAEERQQATPSTSRGSTWTSFQAAVRINHGTTETPIEEDYPIGLWVAVEDVAAPVSYVRFSRRGFRVGHVSLGDAPHDVVLSDADNDGVLGTGDWWALLPEGEAHGMEHSRKVGDFAWSGTQAWKLEVVGTAGREGRLVPFDPGITPEQDARNRDPLWDDKQAERAEQPLVFAHDIEAAIAAAREAGTPWYLDFDTTWCGPCKSMDTYVYTAKDVVEAARGITCIKVDGDEHKELKERHHVESFPTGILFASDGTELARFSGYRGVAQMAAFFRKVSATTTEPAK